MVCADIWRPVPRSRMFSEVLGWFRYRVANEFVLVGAIDGVIAGPVGWVALGGAAIGGLVAKLKDGGFDNSRLEQWGAQLKPGTSALVAVIDHTCVRDVEAALQEAARDIVTLEIGNEISAQLEKG